jgi:hypothetical protein
MRYLAYIVMPGLDRGIHALQPALTSDICASGSPWMPGSSPGMTVFGLMGTANTLAVVNFLKQEHSLG